MSVYIKALNACLENADRWIQDAELLYANESYGHAYAALTYADEELMKACIFWMQTEDVFSKELTDQFRKMTRNHQLKNRILLNFVATLLAAPILTNEEKLQELRNQYREVSREDIERNVDKLVRDKEILRQRSIYVDIVDGKILSPNAITKELVDNLQEGIVIRRPAVQRLFDIPHEQKRQVIEMVAKMLRES